VRGVTRRLTYRARVEALVQRLIDRLDEMDAATTDMEMEEDDDSLEEASGQPLTLCPDWKRPDFGRFPAVRA
jgi:hypothetical protein